MPTDLTIGDKKIGHHEQALVIAEIAQAHDGSLGAAHAYIDAVAEAGADAVKFQTHIASEESTLDEPFRVKFGNQDSSRYEYWHRMEFTSGQWMELAKHAKEKGLIFLSSPFSVKAVEILDKIGVSAWKVASGEVWTEDIFEAMASTGKPFLLSSGMSDYKDIETAVNKARGRGLECGVFQCSTTYPTPFEKVGWNVIDEIRRRFDCPAGLSDHSGSIYTGLFALANNVDMLEVHLVFDHRMFGPDVLASVTIDQLAILAEANEAFHLLRSNLVDKDSAATDLKEMRRLFGKSLALKESQSKGTVLAENMITLKKPGFGIAWGERWRVIGRALKLDVPQNRLLTWEDFS